MLTRALTLFVCFLLAATLIARANQAEPRPVRVSLATMPLELLGWRGRLEAPLDKETLAVLGADDYLIRTYSSARSVAGLYVAYWASQRNGDAIHSPQNCLPGSGWEPVSNSTLEIQVANDTTAAAARQIAVNRYVVQKGLDRELVLYWYQSHGRVVANEYLNKIYLVTDAVRLHRTDAALVRVTVHVNEGIDGEGQAEREGVRFITTLFPMLPQYLPS